MDLFRRGLADNRDEYPIQADRVCIQIYAFAILASMGCRKSCSSLT